MSFFYLAIVQSLLFSLVHSQSCSSQTGVKLTFYGFPDGMSDITSFGCSGTTPLGTSQSGTAGGDGSYASPETFATAMTNTNFKQCEIVYIPYFQKYFQYMDHCEAAIADYAAGLTHMDLWIGPQSNEGQLPCEQAFGVLNDQTVIRSPPSTLPVTSGALVEGATCYNEASSGRVFPSYDASSLCSGSTGSGSPAPISSTTPAQVVTPSTSSVASTPTTTSSPVVISPTTYQSTKEEVKVALNPAPASSSAPATLPVVQVENKVAQHQASAPTTMMTMTSSAAAVAVPATSTATSPPPSGSSGSGKASGPKMNWNSGISYNDQMSAEMASCASWNACLGNTCSGYNDCAGEWICMSGKCHDNKTD